MKFSNEQAIEVVCRAATNAYNNLEFEDQFKADYLMQHYNYELYEAVIPSNDHLFCLYEFVDLFRTDVSTQIKKEAARGSWRAGEKGDGADLTGWILSEATDNEITLFGGNRGYHNSIINHSACCLFFIPEADHPRLNTN
tara:strand:- start:32223 stop:32642 length:420 start_codon:yes stop_codon:yes gene_type:complete